MKLSGDALELWVDELKKLKLRPLTKEEATLYVKTLILDKDLNNDKNLLKYLENGEAGISSIIWHRIRSNHTYKITPALALFIGEYTNIIGVAVMIINYMQYVALKQNINEFTIKHWGSVLFPNGYVEDWQAAWTLQKLDPEERRRSKDGNILGSDNMLDYTGIYNGLLN